MQTRDYSAIALALLEARGPNPAEDSYSLGWVDGVGRAASRIAARIAEHDPTFDREDFLKLTRGE